MLQRKTPLRSKSTLQRKTPLKSGEPLKNGSPLKKGSPLPSGGKGLSRTAPMKRKPPADKPRPAERSPKAADKAKKSPAKPKRLRDGEIGEAQTRRLIRKRSGGICEICGSSPATDAAHRKPRSQGGLWSPSNLLDACHGCHMNNHANPNAAKAGKWHLPSWSDPLAEPVLLVLLGESMTVLLDDAGGWAPAEAA